MNDDARRCRRCGAVIEEEPPLRALSRTADKLVREAAIAAVIVVAIVMLVWALA